MMPNKNKLALLFLLSLIFPWLSGCANQRDMVAVQERVIVAERQNQDLQRQIAALEKQLQNDLLDSRQTTQTAEKTLRTQYASVNVSMDSLQQELRLLGGRMEEIEYLLNRKVTDYEAQGKKNQERLDDISLTQSKIDQRLIAVETYLSLDRKNSATPAAAQSAAPANLYNQGKQAFDKGEWEKARQLFGQLIQNNPKSDDADNAQFWIGETYYNEQWYEKAILEYQTVIEQYPKGNKVPAAMYKQGLAFLKLGDQSNARLVLKRLTEKYPKSNEAAIAAAKLKEL